MFLITKLLLFYNGLMLNMMYSNILYINFLTNWFFWKPFSYHTGTTGRCNCCDFRCWCCFIRRYCQTNNKNQSITLNCLWKPEQKDIAYLAVDVKRGHPLGTKGFMSFSNDDSPYDRMITRYCKVSHIHSLEKGKNAKHLLQTRAVKQQSRWQCRISYIKLIYWSWRRVGLRSVVRFELTRCHGGLQMEIFAFFFLWEPIFLMCVI